jgi:hypothetical protein
LAAQQRAAQQAASAANAAGGSALGSYALGQMVDIASFSLWSLLNSRNHIHNDVVKEIEKRNIGVKINTYISEGVTRTKTGKGSMDLNTIKPNSAQNLNDGFTEVWDVKPESYAKGRENHAKGIEQVKGYIEALKLNSDTYPNPRPGGGYIADHPIPFEDKTGRFLITYKNQLDGLIIYSFHEKPKKEKDKKDAVYYVANEPNSYSKARGTGNVLKFPTSNKSKELEEQIAAMSPFDETWLTIKVLATYEAKKIADGAKQTVNFSWYVLSGQFIDDFFNSCSGGIDQYGNPITCFTEETLVSTSHGYVKISEIKEGDLVFAYDPKSKKMRLKRVMRIFSNVVTKLIFLTIEGNVIRTTPEHPFFVEDIGWTEACEIVASDKIQCMQQRDLTLAKDGKLKITTQNSVVVEKVESVDLTIPVWVYNFEIEDFHTYYVSQSNLLVHNRCS